MRKVELARKVETPGSLWPLGMLSARYGELLNTGEVAGKMALGPFITTGGTRVMGFFAENF